MGGQFGISSVSTFVWGDEISYPVILGDCFGHQAINKKKSTPQNKNTLNNQGRLGPFSSKTLTLKSPEIQEMIYPPTYLRMIQITFYREASVTKLTFLPDPPIPPLDLTDSSSSRPAFVGPLHLVLYRDR